MKHSTPKTFSALSLILTLCLGALNLKAAVTYWDPAGVVAVPYTGDLTGTWENISWSSASGGTASPIAWVEANAACFGVGTGKGTPPFTVTVNGNHTIAGIFDGNLNPNSCQVTLMGPGILTLKSANENALEAITSSDGALGWINISNTLAGDSTAILTCEGGTGQLFLHGTNTWAGGTELGYSGLSFGGLLWINNNLSLGTGKIVVGNTAGGLCALLSDVNTPITITNRVVFTNFVTTAKGINIVPQSASGPITFSGPWALHATVTNANIYVNDSATKKAIISGVISGGTASGFLNKGNKGILQLSGANTYANTTTVSNGVLMAGINTCIPSGAGKGDLIVAVTATTAGIFDLNGFSPSCNGLFGDSLITNSATGAGTLTAGNNNISGTFSGTIAETPGNGTIGFTKNGTGTMIMTGTSTYSGATTVNGGTLVVGVPTLPPTSPINIASGATLDINYNSMSVTNLSGRGNLVHNIGTLTVNGNSTNGSSLVTYAGYSGNIDNGGLVKAGTETMSLRGTNNLLYSGVQLNSGALCVGAGPNRILSSGGAVLTIANGATFELCASPGESIAQLSGSGFIDLEGGSLVVDTGIGNVFSGVIRDSDLPGSSTALGHGLRGYYYDNQDFTSLLAVQDDPNINFTTITNGTNLPPQFTTNANMSVRWLGQILAPATGTYTFTVASDDGSRLWVNGICVEDNWVTQGGTARSGTVDLTAGTRYDIVLEYFNQTGGTSCIMRWTPPGDTVSTVIPTDNLFLPGAGRLVKANSGSLQLTSSNSYSGTTVVNGGTLQASADGALGKGNVTVGDGAVLTLDTGTVNNYIDSGADLVVIGSGSVNLNYTGTDTVRSLSLDGGVTYKAAGTYGALGSGAQHEDSHFNGSGFIRVAGLPSTTTLNSSTATALYNSSVTFTAHVTGSSATPTGTVVFYDGTSAIGAVALDGTGTAVLAVTNLTVVASPHSVTATYTGNATYGTSTSAAVTETITPINLTSVVFNNKVYDQTTAATLFTNSVAGVLAADTNFVHVASTGWTATFADKNVGTNKATSVTGLTLSGSASGNYTINSSATGTANISSKPIIATGATAQSKVYDGTTTAVVDASSAVTTNFYAGDDAQLNTSGGATGTFVNANVGNNKVVTVVIPTTGADGPNYLVTNSTTASITKATSTLNLVSSKPTANSGDSVSFTATVVPSNAGVGTGNVIFLTNSVPFSTNALSANSATSASTTLLPVGTTPITAQWVGDSNVGGSTNSALVETVNNAVVQPGALTITNQSGNITITWAGTFNLQSVPALQSAGTLWQTVPNATSPYPVPTTNPAAFYRLSN
jgi:autotransporter-associated beta strand protein